MTEPVIRMEDVSYAYRHGENVLEHVDLQVERGSFLAIIGPNGGGKTTLIKLLLGLLEPASGTILVNGRNPKDKAPMVGYVPQNAALAPSFPITVMDVVLLGLNRCRHQRFGLPRAHADQAMKVLEQVSMDRYATRRYDRLSGGQRQRVLVARAMVSSPKLLLFDEPTSNIDPQGKNCLFEMLADLSKEITVVMVSHDPISASASITDIAVVNTHLIQGRELTPDMLELIYGTHDASCPVDGYVRSLSSVFDLRMARHD